MIKKIILASSLFFIIGFIGCKKEDEDLKSQTSVSKENSISKNLPNSPSSQNQRSRIMTNYTLYKASRRQISDSVNAFLTNFLTQQTNVFNRPSACGTMMDMHSMIESITISNSGCTPSGTVEISYKITALEYGNPGFFDVDFLIDNSILQPTSTVPLPSYVMPIPGTAVSVVVHTFDVILNISAADYSLFGGSTQKVTRTGDFTQYPNCVTRTINHFTLFEISPQWYLLHPAVIYIIPNTTSSGIYVFNQCNILTCTPPHVTQCPLSGIFKYRLIGTTSWTSINMNLAFYLNGITGLPSGNYEYECILTYALGNTLPATGNFTI